MRPTNCRRCAAGPLAPENDKSAPIRHAGRGLCVSCWSCLCKRRDRGHVVEGDDFIDYERVTRPSVEVIEDWRLLSAQGLSKRQAAARMGMTFAALDQALVRHRRRERATC